MPTAAKLVSALMLSALAWMAATLIVPLLPEGMVVGSFVQVTAIFGLIAGWKVLGPRLGGGYANAVTHGLTGVITLVVIALFFHSAWMMVENALKRRYDGPMEATVGIFEIMLENLQIMAVPQVLGLLACGGIVSGVIGEFVARRAN